jgi:4-amino-4-deoxy-L-arabinose transferase-like glycosyltransferase
METKLIRGNSVASKLNQKFNKPWGLGNWLSNCYGGLNHRGFAILSTNIEPTVKPKPVSTPLTYSYIYLAVILVAAAVYLGCIISPPSLMDDVDATQAQIARNMVTSGDWVTARLDGVPFLEKGPLIYWSIAVLFQFFGAHDWLARIPVALASIGLAWLTAAFGVWAFGRKAGLYAGLIIGTCIGLFLFTRVLIPDVMITFTACGLSCARWRNTNIARACGLLCWPPAWAPACC